jgi:hypothetical protein
MHQYREWLVETVANILEVSLTISSAGRLKGGAIAWVEVSVPDSVTTPEDVVFRPNLLAATTFDGSIATTFKRAVIDFGCDNTLDGALAQRGPTYMVNPENADLRRANEILKAVSAFFAAGSSTAHQVLTAFTEEHRQVFGGRADLHRAVRARGHERPRPPTMRPATGRRRGDRSVAPRSSS